VSKIKCIVALAVIAFSGAAIADPDPTRVPLDQAIISVGKNIAKNPDNPGLPKAGLRLIINQDRQSTRDHPRGREVGPERSERVERPERPERIEIVTRADIARAHRPERPERPGKK
jgi:hypothetical protein